MKRWRLFAGIFVGLVMLLGVAHAVPAQQASTPAAPLAFEVASIKANNSGDRSTNWGCNGIDGGDKAAPVGRCIAKNASLKLMIATAYRVQFLQMDQVISGSPSWLDVDRYDIEAKSDPPATEAQLYLMLQTLLADRLKLKVHWENKEMPNFALTVAASGPKLHESMADEKTGANMGPARITAQKLSMSQLAQMLSGHAGRSVVDKTGLTGTYDLTLSWQPDTEASSAGDRTGPSLFTALQEQLGLKLEARKGQTQAFLIIDHVEKPTLN